MGYDPRRGERAGGDRTDVAGRAPRRPGRRRTAARPPRGRPGCLRAVVPSTSQSPLARRAPHELQPRRRRRVPPGRDALRVPVRGLVPRRLLDPDLAASHRRQLVPRPHPPQQGAPRRRRPPGRRRRSCAPRSHVRHRASDRVEHALAELPPEQRAAIVAVDLEGFSTSEAAARLGVPEGTIKSRCARGRKRLVVSLGHLRGDETEPPPQREPERTTREPARGLLRRTKRVQPHDERRAPRTATHGPGTPEPGRGTR
ncbi:RNA polymerase sigma factor SigM [Rhodococcus rhodnii LMG 5362]|uniref:RNA polymerase sigma factor SigM n=1 Tax=Rhodococcus rhodnii LMG 5362 TaxID=1273125 RepID=R7WK52_9NOCA|nr:RNA polymerase sigma factor SigM [Rhodococcus rhodnii LMG 5362]